MIKIPNIAWHEVRINSEFKAVGERSGLRLRFKTQDGRPHDWRVYYTPKIERLHLVIEYHVMESIEDLHWYGTIRCSPTNGMRIEHQSSGESFIDYLRKITINN